MFGNDRQVTVLRESQAKRCNPTFLPQQRRNVLGLVSDPNLNLCFLTFTTIINYG